MYLYPRANGSIPHANGRFPRAIGKLVPPGPIFHEKIGPPDQYSMENWSPRTKIPWKIGPPDQYSMENWSIVGPKFSA